MTNILRVKKMEPIFPTRSLLKRLREQDRKRNSSHVMDESDDGEDGEEDDDDGGIAPPPAKLSVAACQTL